MRFIPEPSQVHILLGYYGRIHDKRTWSYAGDGHHY